MFYVLLFYEPQSLSVGEEGGHGDTFLRLGGGFCPAWAPVLWSLELIPTPAWLLTDENGEL